MTFPLKTLQLSGKLMDFQIRQRICFNYCNLNSGTWELAIADFSFHTDTTLIEKILCNLSCNVVVGTQYSSSGVLTSETIKLLRFQINDNEQCGLTFFPIRWFTINNVNEYFILFLEQWPLQNTKILIPKTCLITFTILLRKIN